jgi:hypothetical protein
MKMQLTDEQRLALKKALKEGTICHRWTTRITIPRIDIPQFQGTGTWMPGLDDYFDNCVVSEWKKAGF